MTFLLADGVVPSNEDRGYILRRIMRRAMQQGRVLGIEESFLPRLCERVGEVMGDAYPELRARGEHHRALGARPRRRASVGPWPRARSCWPSWWRAAKEEGTSWVSAEDAFRLHDTYGFPYEMTRELLAEQGLSVDDQGFEELMERAREVSRGGAARAGGGDSGIAFPHEKVLRFAREAGFPSRFVGYEATEWETVVGALDDENGHLLAKLEESPFYPEGGGQVSDSGLVETPVRAGTGGGRVPARRRPGAGARAGGGRDRAGRVGAGDRRAADPARHDAQPHGHPSAARRAARAARHPRAPGRLVRGPGQAALRLHPRRQAVAGGAGRHRGAW